jgi:hypothetical protein
MAVRKRPIAWAVSVTFVASVALVQTPALAHGAGGGSGGGRVIAGSAAGARPAAHHPVAPN